jgi:hypothetical protein
MRMPVCRSRRKEVGAKIIASAQFFLKQAIVLGREGARQALRTSRNVLAAEQLS